MRKILNILLILVLTASCNEYQKALKSEDVAIKYELANKLYESEKYHKAIRLFEQIAPSYRGKPQAEKLFFMFAQSYYKTKQYYLAAYQFDSFSNSYPKSEKSEEAAFLGAKCYSKLSPVYSLDQVDTYKAIEKMQNFIDVYPKSTYLNEANVIVKDLREKIEKKFFEVAKGYHTIIDYKTAIVALENFILEYPGTPFKENAMFLKFDSAYQLAINSVPSKMEERLNAAKNYGENILKFKADTKYLDKINEMNKRIELELNKFTKK